MQFVSRHAFSGTAGNVIVSVEYCGDDALIIVWIYCFFLWLVVASEKCALKILVKFLNMKSQTNNNKLRPKNKRFLKKTVFFFYIFRINVVYYFGKCLYRTEKRAKMQPVDILLATVMVF